MSENEWNELQNNKYFEIKIKQIKLIKIEWILILLKEFIKSQNIKYQSDIE